MAKKPTKGKPKRVTNADLDAKFNKVISWMTEHEVADNNRFSDGNTRMGTLATTEALNEFKALMIEPDGETLKVASKKDVEELMTAFHKFTQAVSLVQGGSKWAFRVLLTIAAIVVALTTIVGGWKGVLMSFPWFNR